MPVWWCPRDPSLNRRGEVYHQRGDPQPRAGADFSSTVKGQPRHRSSRFWLAVCVQSEFCGVVVFQWSKYIARKGAKFNGASGRIDFAVPHAALFRCSNLHSRCARGKRSPGFPSPTVSFYVCYFTCFTRLRLIRASARWIIIGAPYIASIFHARIAVTYTGLPPTVGRSLTYIYFEDGANWHHAQDLPSRADASKMARCR